MSYKLTTPVSIFFYRRPDHLARVMGKVREVQPAVLFGISDGPKTENLDSQKGVEESRKIFREAIDWPCHWEVLERESNQGSYLSVSKGLDWVFEKVNETIILEDDTVPDTSFFRFTAELLERFRGDERIGSVCGSNFDAPSDWTSEASYRFTRYHHGWGWGTWKRAWKFFDRDERLQADILRIRKENWMGLSRSEWAYWQRCFKRTYVKQLDAWDYRWTLSLWAHRMMCIIPRVNLVQNIGFGQQATHTVEREFADLEMHKSQPQPFPLISPEKEVPNAMLDEKVFQKHYQVLEGRRNLWQKIRDRYRRMRGKAWAGLPAS